MSHAILARQPRQGHRSRRYAGRCRSRRRHRRHAVAQPALATAASSTTRRTAARPTPTRRRSSRRGPTSSSGPGSRTSSGSRSPRRVPARRHTTSWAPTSTTCPRVVDLARIKDAGVRIGADPLGGAAVDYWGAIADRHGLDLTVVNPLVDPTWRFMTLDWDGKIRMDCSSPAAMASLIARKDDYDISTGNDADSDRHGIVTPDAGLMNPNHYLAVAIQYLYGGARPQWRGHGHRQDARVQLDDRPRRRRPRAPAARGAGRASSGSCPGCSTAPVGSAARSRRVRPSSGSTARSGRPTRTGSSSRCSPPRSSRRRAGPRASTTRELTERHGDAGIRPHRRPGRPRAEGQAGALTPDAVTRGIPCGRGDHGQAHRGARQRRRDRRPQGRHRERVVRRPAVRHRGRLQDLRRVVQGPGAPGAGAGGGQGRRGRRPRQLTPRRRCRTVASRPLTGGRLATFWLGPGESRAHVARTQLLCGSLCRTRSRRGFGGRGGGRRQDRPVPRWSPGRHHRGRGSSRTAERPGSPRRCR